MAGSAVFKIRCPACGKSFRMEGGDTAVTLFCRACGAKLLTQVPPLLGPLEADGAGHPVLEATLISGGVSSADVPAIESRPVEAVDVPAVSAAAASSPAQAVDLSAYESVRDAEVIDVSAIGEPVQPAPAPEGASTDSVELPWAATPRVPETPPPPASGLLLPPPIPEATPLRLIPTRTEPGDPDLEAQRLAMSPPWIPPAPPPITASPFATRASPMAAAVTRPPVVDPSADTAVLPAMAAEVPDPLRDAFHAPPTTAPLQADHHRHGHPFWWVALGMVSAAAVVLFLLAAMGQVDWFDPWEKQAYPAVAQLKSEAEAFAVRGALRESHERYQKIDDLIAGRDIRDVQLRETVEASRQDARRVYDVLLGRLAEHGRPAPAANPVPVAPPVGPAPVATNPAATTNDDEPSPTPVVSQPTTQRSGVATAQPTQPEGVAPPSPPTRVRPAANPAPQGRVRPAPRPVRAPADGPLTDAEIGESIQAGVNFLLKQFDGTTHVVRGGDRRNDPAYFAGLDALAVYALLQAGHAIEDPRVSHRDDAMRARLEALRNLPIDGGHQTYARGLRATCLALFNRPDDFKVMAGDVDWLLGTTDGGAYGYDGTFRTIGQRGNFPSRGGSWDNSNSQYGLLGVWSGIEADPRIEVPLAYWKAVDRHWTESQGPDGQWAYVQGTSGSGRLTMTCAGIASLLVAHEYLEPPTTTGTVGREPYTPALRKALAWFERGNNSVNVRDGNWWGYTLYGIERVGLASGFKHFGTHDWYRELSEKIVRKQLTNGSWGDGIVDTSYAVIFLSRGRHPILMNKLRFDGYWSNRPRDVSNMARFASRQFERPINWQVVNIENPWTDWTDSPILYIASHEPVKLTDEHLEKLRRFVRSGGMIFTHADAGSPTFDQWARELASKLFSYELTDVPDNHPIWSSVYKLTARPALLGVSNGSRLLMVHSPSDITLKWQQRADRAYESRPNPARPATAVVPDSDTKTRNLASFHFGMNLFVYAAGKRDLRNRLDSAWVEAPSSAPIDTVRVARVQYGGNWNPEPGAWERYANWFHHTTGTRLDVQPVKLRELGAESVATYPLAHLTGTARVGFSDEDAAALRSYVEGGGVVLVDPTGGMNAFDTEVRESLLIKMFPERFARLLDGSHPLMAGDAPGMEDVGKTIVRGYTLERLGGGIGTVQMLTPEHLDKAGPRPGAVIVTSLDLTSGLLGTNVWGVLGFQNRYAQSLVKNVIFWTVDGRAQQ